MREVCTCGAVFEFIWPKTNWAPERMEQVYGWLLEWRENHRHEPREPEPEPERQGAGMSDNQLAHRDRDWSHPTIGFTPNGW